MKLHIPLIALALTACALPARASLNIAVDPMVVEMHALPGRAVTTDVNFSNTSGGAERIVLSPMDWTTRIDGSFAIEKPGKERRSITSYLKASEYQFVLQPGQKRVIQVSLTLPVNFSSAAASYWGGFFTRATLMTGRLNGFGPGATVVVYADVGNPRRSLDMQSLKATASGSEVYVIGRVRNNSNAYVRAGGNLLFEQAGRIVQKVPVTIGAIFPSRFHTISETVHGLAAGKYRVALSIDYGGDTIEDGETTVIVP